MKGSILVAMFGGLLASGCFFVSTDPPPKDEVLLKSFSDHRAAFDDLAAFCRRFPAVSRIAFDFTHPSDLREIGVSAEELTRVRKLMGDVGCSAGLIRTYGSGGSMFAFFAEGLPSGGVEKGIAFMDTVPDSIEPSLDAYGWDTVAHTRRFRVIDGKWFVYFKRD